METLLAVLFGVGIGAILALLVWYWRTMAPSLDEGGERKAPWRAVLTIQHTHRVTHDVTPEAVALLAEAIDGAVRDYYARLDNRPVPPAVPLSMPDEPEARLARERSMAASVLRGAERLQADAKARGLSLSQADAMAQAQAMYVKATDTNL